MSLGVATLTPPALRERGQYVEEVWIRGSGHPAGWHGWRLEEGSRGNLTTRGHVVERVEQPRARHRDLADDHAEVGDRVFDRVRDRRGAGDGAALADALDAEGVDHRGVRLEGDRQRWELIGLGDRVVHEARGQELAVLVVDDRFHEPGADRLGSAALELALDDRRIDRAAGVVDDRIGEEPDRARLHLDLHDGRVRSERPRDRPGMEVGAGVAPGPAEGTERR